MNLIQSSSEEYGKHVLQVEQFLRTERMESEDTNYKRKVQRQSLRFVVRQGRMFRRQIKIVVAVVPKSHSGKHCEVYE